MAKALEGPRHGDLTTLATAAVTVRTTPALELGTPRALFALPGLRVWKDSDVSPDGTRFLTIVTDVRGDQRPLTVVMNWTAGGWAA